MNSEIPKASENTADSKEKRVSVFIDASNLWAVQKSKGKLFDYEKLKGYLVEKFGATSIEIFYYSARPTQKARDYDLAGQSKFFGYLKLNLGFNLRIKKLKSLKLVDAAGKPTGEFMEKGNVDVEMTIDAILGAKFYDIAILFSGDSDFLPLITRLRNFGKKVYVFSSKNNVSRELRSGSDGYFDLLKIKKDIWRGTLNHREAKNKAALLEEGRP